MVFEIEANFTTGKSSIDQLKTRGIRELHPKMQIPYYVGSMVNLLGKNEEPELQISVGYGFQGKKIEDSRTFYLADFKGSSVIEPSPIKAANIIAKVLEQVSKNVQEQSTILEAISNISDGTGLRLSQRTLALLKNEKQIFDPREFDWRGYTMILDISPAEASQLESIFQLFGFGDDRRRMYEQLPEALRSKFEQHFRVDFE
ncbi:MAG: hypothetical protein GVY13_03905 [Alphaproteobacteria bacterium]|nr:hypothetical protein [Alphaproteobacteria bacterium]